MSTVLRKTFFMASALFYSLTALADIRIPTREKYESGRLLCETKHKEMLAYEKGFYTEVPMDYSDPSKGTTPVYAYFAGDYNPQRDTVLYFTGGPGQTAHWQPIKVDVNFNLLIMEQRGIGCSRPDKIENYLSRSFYSSLNVAKDAEMLRQKLKIPKITVYGISYGTIPATIYASLFPQHTRAAIMEGTVLAGESALWEAPHRRKLLQNMLDTLPADVKTILKRVSVENPIPDTWLSMMARQELMSNDGLVKLRASLMKLRNPQDYSEFVRYVSDMIAPPQFEPHPLFISNEIPYFMISCQEMGLGQPGVADKYSLIDGSTLVPAADESFYKDCQKLGVKTGQIYSALQYPVTVPVTYFQGTDDSATTAPLAIKHYKSVAKGTAQMLLLRKGGHNPSLTLINSETPGQKEIFETAVRGQIIPEALLEKVNQNSDLKWVMTSRTP